MIANRRSALGIALVASLCATPLVAEEIVIQAADMSARDRGVVPADAKWGGLAVFHGSGGFEEWAATVKQAGKHYIHFLYCSGQSRPCRLSINGKVLPGTVLGETTGGFLPQQLQWKTLGPFDLVTGKNSIRLTALGHMPHFRGLVVSTDKTLAKKTVFGPVPRAEQRGAPAQEPAAPLVAMLGKGKVQLRDSKQAAIAGKLAEAHKGIRLKPDELLRITNWVDTNAQYYGSWWGRRHIQHKDHPNFRPTPTFEAAVCMTSPIPEDRR